MSNSMSNSNNNEGMMRFFDRDKFSAYLGLKLLEVRPGYAVVKMDITENHLNIFHAVHGGATFALADFAFAAASNSQGQAAVAINVSISYFRSPTGKTLVAKAEEIFRNPKLASYNVDIFDDNDELIARFTGMVYRKKDKNEFGTTTGN